MGVLLKLTVEDASLQHLDKLCEIEGECFDREAFTRQQMIHLLTDYNSVSLVAKVDDKIVGFIIGMIYFDRSSSVGHILTIDVLPAYRRRGIGQKLLQEMEKIFRGKGVRTCRLEVREDNAAALQLYKKLGYEVVARLKNYYGNVHGIYLRKNLT
jgi:ribosomal-protein-alanine acetyltransferase